MKKGLIEVYDVTRWMSESTDKDYRMNNSNGKYLECCIIR